MPDLPKRTLGRTGMNVTTLGYGAMELRGAPRGRDVSDEQAERILNAVLDAGVNFIDTSIDYGVAEERIGRYISRRRSEYFLASKCGCLAGDLVNNPPPLRGNQRLRQRGTVGRRRAAHAAQQRREGRHIVNHRLSLRQVDRAGTPGHRAQRLHQRAAQPQHDQPPEQRVVT